MSRKTGTTTRKRTLLLRAAGLGGGTFKADNNRLLQINPMTGRARTGAYYLIRQNLREALNGEQTSVPVFYNNQLGAQAFSVHHEDGVLQIGCKRFTGRKAAALKTWALEEN